MVGAAESTGLKCWLGSNVFANTIKWKNQAGEDLAGKPTHFSIDEDVQSNRVVSTLTRLDVESGDGIEYTCYVGPTKQVFDVKVIGMSVSATNCFINYINI